MEPEKDEEMRDKNELFTVCVVFVDVGSEDVGTCVDDV